MPDIIKGQIVNYQQNHASCKQGVVVRINPATITLDVDGRKVMAHRILVHADNCDHCPNREE